MIQVRLLTPEDLSLMKGELIAEITSLLSKGHYQKPILTNEEVQHLLGVSSGTIRSYRIQGILPYSKIGQVLYYQYEDIKNLIIDKRIQSTSPEVDMRIA